MRAEIHSSIASVGRDAWQRMRPGDPESWDYYKAVEDVAPQGFTLGAISVHDGARLVAAAPIFQVHYRIDTPLQGALRKAGQWLFERVPRLVSLPVIGIGSPMSDNCTIAFAPELTDAERTEAFDTMLSGLEEMGEKQKAGLFAVKSLDEQADAFASTFAARHYAQVTSVPLVLLDLPFKSYDEYLASLPAKIRGYLKRKARANAHVRMENRTSIAGLEREIFDLFQATLAHSKVDYGEFEQLTPDYFPRVLAALGDNAQFTLCWHDDKLIGFQLSLVGAQRIVTKHIGMRYPEAREFNLYFLNWLQMIEFAISRQIPLVEMGATTYATKLLFGGRMSRRWLHFRFRGAIANRLLRPFVPLFDFERNDPELKALAETRAKAGDAEA